MKSMPDQKRSVLLVGATGVVGRGIARQLSAANWKVTAVARDTERLSALARDVPGIEVRVGSIGNDSQAAELAERLQSAGAPFDAMVVSVNLPPFTTPLLDCSGERLLEVLQGNLVTHLCAARGLLPLLVPGGRYVGIGGGMADFVVAGLGPVSICQAAQRNMFRFLAMEAAERGVSVVELMLYSQIVDPADESSASPRDIRADEVGEHVRAVLERPDEFTGPILVLKSRKQVGQVQRD